MNRLTIIRLLMTLTLVLGTSAMAWAQLDQWTAVGSDGTPDDLDEAIFDTAGSAVQVKSGAPLPLLWTCGTTSSPFRVSSARGTGFD